MKNPEQVNPDDDEKELAQALPVEEVAEAVEDDSELAAEIKEVQVELAENIESLSESVTQLKELEGEKAGFFTKAKNLLRDGLKKIENYLSDSTLFIIANSFAVGSTIRNITEGNDVGPVATAVLGTAVVLGLTKLGRYFMGGSEAKESDNDDQIQGARLISGDEVKTRGLEVAEPVKGSEEVPAEGKEVVEEVEEALPAEDDIENQIQELKDGIKGEYDKDEK